MNLRKTVCEIMGKQVSSGQAKDFAEQQFGVLASFLKKKESKRKFPNGFASWQETHCELVSMASLDYERDDDIIVAFFEEKGTGGFYELMEDLTNDFEKSFEGYDFDGDYFPAIEGFWAKEKRKLKADLVL